jgi:hypothetical protein
LAVSIPILFPLSLSEVQAFIRCTVFVMQFYGLCPFFQQ